MAAKLTAQQQRDRRSRIILGVLCVVFVGVLALELPKVMKSGGSSGAIATPPAATTTTATTTTTTAAAGSTAAAPVAVSAAPTSLASIRNVVTPQAGQLARFTEFAPKDPFRAVPGSKSTAAQGGSPASPTTSPTPANPAGATAKAPPTPPVSFSVLPGSKAGQAASGPLVPAALLRYDGKQRVVALGDTFPVKQPLFRLVSMSSKAIWLKLLGGSFADGKSTLKVLRGHPVTLLNTTAGTHFVLALLHPTTAHPRPAAATPAAK